MHIETCNLLRNFEDENFDKNLRERAIRKQLIWTVQEEKYDKRDLIEQLVTFHSQKKMCSRCFVVTKGKGFDCSKCSVMHYCVVICYVRDTDNHASLCQKLQKLSKEEESSSEKFRKEIILSADQIFIKLMGKINERLRTKHSYFFAEPSSSSDQAEAATTNSADEPVPENFVAELDSAVVSQISQLGEA